MSPGKGLFVYSLVLVENSEYVNICYLVPVGKADEFAFGKAKTLQTHHVYSALMRRWNDRFHVVSTWNTRGVFVGELLNKMQTSKYYQWKKRLKARKLFSNIFQCNWNCVGIYFGLDFDFFFIKHVNVTGSA